jgi:hypothetical protein
MTAQKDPDPAIDVLDIGLHKILTLPDPFFASAFRIYVEAAGVERSAAALEGILDAAVQDQTFVALERNIGRSITALGYLRAVGADANTGPGRDALGQMVQGM